METQKKLGRIIRYYDRLVGTHSEYTELLEKLKELNNQLKYEEQAKTKDERIRP